MELGILIARKLSFGRISTAASLPVLAISAVCDYRFQNTTIIPNSFLGGRLAP